MSTSKDDQEMLARLKCDHFLLSDLASYITGSCINIDGGSSLDSHSQLWPIPESDLTFAIPPEYLHKTKKDN